MNDIHIQLVETIRKYDSNPDRQLLENQLGSYDMNFRTPSGETLLFEVVQWIRNEDFQLEIINKFILLGMNPNHSNYNYGRTVGFYTKSAKVLKLLVSKGLNVNHIDNSDWTAAHYNISSTELFKEFIDLGLDLNYKRSNNQNIVFSIINDDRIDDLKKYKLLETHPQLFEEQDIHGFTPLMYSIVVDNFNSASYLLSKNLGTSQLTLKDYNFTRFTDSENPITIPSGSTYRDMNSILSTWLDSNSNGNEYLEEYKYNLENLENSN